MVKQKSEFDSLLLQILSNSERNGKFSAIQFFAQWFKEHGSAYFFLFKKNLNVTNIQFAELLALLRTHIKTKESSESIHQLQFVSTSEFSSTIQEIGDRLASSRSEPNAKYELVTKLYSSLLHRVVVLDAYFSSCAIYVPPHLSVDLAIVTAQSGYIHSCGQNVYIRNMTKASKRELFQVIQKHLDATLPAGKKLFFALYAHEDFTLFEREKAAELRGGLNDVKLYVEKLYIGSDRLVSVVKEMKARFRDSLVIPDPGNFKIVHRDFRDKPNVERKRTIWLICDRSISRDNRHPGDDHYFILYDQAYLNENPFHLFDENKPAWIDHTTIPHTLAGAMINITRPWPKQRQPVVLVDPFVGTGTLWLEGLKFSDNELSTRCSDLNPLSPILTQDNLFFFALPPEDLINYETKLKSLSHFLRELQLSPTSDKVIADKSLIDAYAWSIEFLSDVITRSSGTSPESIDFTLDDAHLLRSRSFLDRLLFYVALRANKRNLAAFERESRDWFSAYNNELDLLISQVGELINLCKNEHSTHLSQPLEALNLVFLGNYSLTTTLGFKAINRYQNTLPPNVISVLDARSLPQNFCDVIVTDPPYGFNTDDDSRELAELYEQVMRTMVGALRDDGHIVFCLPDQSRTGRQLPFFTRRGLVIQQMLAICEQMGREVINSVFAVPQPASLFRPPYYWESERALRRLILHFRIRRLS